MRGGAPAVGHAAWILAWRGASEPRQDRIADRVRTRAGAKMPAGLRPSTPQPSPCEADREVLSEARRSWGPGKLDGQVKTTLSNSMAAEALPAIDQLVVMSLKGNILLN